MIILNEVEEKIFRIISYVGVAKGKYMEGLQQAKIGDYEAYENLKAEGNQFLIEGHKIHSEMVQKEAAGEEQQISLLLIHAEDQFMSTENLKVVIEETVELYKIINKLKTEITE